MDVNNHVVRERKSSSRKRHKTREKSRERGRKLCRSESQSDKTLILTHHGHTERRRSTRGQHLETPEVEDGRKRRRKIDGSRGSVDGSHRHGSKRHSRSRHRRRHRRESKRCSSDTSMESKHESRSKFKGDSTQLLLTELIKSISNNKSEGNKFPLLGNVIPEFDPMIKEQTINTWLGKVEECARLYKWGEDQVMHYALPKLSGVAKTWYQTLPSMSFSWPGLEN